VKLKGSSMPDCVFKAPRQMPVASCAEAVVVIKKNAIIIKDLNFMAI
jgi:hypothetical protein